MAHFNPSIDFIGKIGYTSEATISGDIGRTARERRANARNTTHVEIMALACAQKLEPMCYNLARETGKRETKRGKTFAAKH
jgi:hypothetical protein